MQQGSTIGNGNRRNRTRHVLGAQRGAFKRVDRDIDSRPFAGSDRLANVKHRRLVPLALSDHDRAVNRQPV
jgi:hypothetical protein